MIGDIILQKRSGTLGWIVSFFTRSEYVHCGIELNNDTVVHVYPFKGKTFEPIENWDDGNLIRLTPVIPLSEKQITCLQWVIAATVVKGYDYFSAIRSWLWKSKDDLKYTGKYYHCSEFTSSAFREGCGIDLVPNRSDDATQPHDFLTSPHLQQVLEEK